MHDVSQLYCVIDWETYSEADLKKQGAWEYSVDPTTEIICAAWRIGTRETLRSATTFSWCPSCNTKNVLGLINIMHNESVLLVAHNSGFEQIIAKNVFIPKYVSTVDQELASIPPNRWLCTASLAATLSLPRKLEDAANVLRLDVRKDMEGSKLIKKWCKPRKPTKKNPKTRHDDPAELARIVQYCKTDVDTEVELFLACPPLNATERKVWELDQVINLRGFEVDRPLVKMVLELVDEEVKELDQETVALSGGELYSTTQREATKNWLEQHGVFLPNMQKKTIEDAIAEKLANGVALRMLEIRQHVSKSSTAKYDAFEMRSRHDSRVRDSFLYHGANTGRWSGAGVQPQNLVRGTIKNTIQAADILASGDLEFIRLVYGDPMSVFSSCLRNVIVAPKGRTLDVGDYSAIEARVLFWVAKHEEGLRAFREGRGLYEEQAADIFQVRIDKINPYQRFLGKSAILGAGYGMGPKKFAATCKAQGQEVSEDLAKAAISSYRERHSSVPRLWKVIELAAISAVRNPGKKYAINRTAWFMSGDFLKCELPSGRLLSYHKPVVIFEKPPWGGEDKAPKLYYWCVDGTTKQWTRTANWGGGLVENVVQAIARDLLAEAMLRIEETGLWQIVLTAHDEIVAERDVFDTGSNTEFCRLMSVLPKWAEGLPVKTEGFESVRYRK